MTEYERAKASLLNHYADLQTDGRISEEEMENRMDRLGVLPIQKVINMARQLKYRKQPRQKGAKP